MSISALIDCGSVVSLIESKIANRLKLLIKPYTGREVKAVNGSPVIVIGETEIPISITIGGVNRTAFVKLGVVENFDFSLLLGMDFNRKVGLVIDCHRESVTLIESPEANADKYKPNNETRCLHAAQSIIIKPNDTHFLKVVPNDKKKYRQFLATIRNN